MRDSKLLDRYILQDKIGQGGMGSVYQVHDTLLDRQVAIKILNQASSDPEGNARLLREARAAAKLNHTNIVAIYDAGEVDFYSDDTLVPYIIMELVEGQTLHSYKPADLDQVVAVAQQVSAALEQAHAVGIIHRDLKPENVIITDTSAVKLMDFGLAQLDDVTRLTQEGALVGTVAYIAPEIIQGSAAGVQSDLYAFGVMLYEMAAGRLPFEGDNMTAVLSQHLYAPAVPPSTYNEQISAELDHLILRLLSKTPAKRPPSAAAVNESLASPAIISSSSQAIAVQPSLVNRLVRGKLVGRTRELSAATDNWLEAARGDAQVLLVSGEPGIGKTRLVRELTTYVKSSGGFAQLGECFDEGNAPYAPFSQIILDVLSSPEMAQNLDLPDLILADLIAIAPSLRVHFGDIPSNPSLDSKTEQQRMFESVVALCSALSARAPLLLIIEDVHWADAGSLLLLRHLARRGRAANLRMMIVLTYREMELSETRAFKDTLLELNRERLATRVKLLRLDRAQTHDLLEAMLAEEITPEFLDGIFQETEGNPFFIEEVCKALVENGMLSRSGGRWHRPDDVADMEIPQSVRLTIESRIGKLSAACQVVLKLAAVIGREFDFETLLAAGDMDEEQLILPLEEAEQAQLITEVPHQPGPGPVTGQIVFAFAHALIPTTLREDLSTLRLRRLHSHVALAIEKTRQDDYESLSYHFAAAGYHIKALEYAQQAAQRARLVHAYEEAERHLRLALELADAGKDMRWQIGLLEEMGDVLKLLGQDTSAVAFYQQALALLSQLSGSDGSATLRLHRKIVDTIVHMTLLEDYKRMESALAVSSDAGLLLAEGVPPSGETVKLFTALSYNARIRVKPRDWDEVENYAHMAVKMAEKLNNPVELSNALSGLVGVYADRGQFRELFEISQQRLELSRDPRFHNPRERVGILLSAASAYFHLGKFKEALDLLMEAESLSAQIQAVYELVRAYRAQSLILLWTDRWDELMAVEDKWRSLYQRYSNFLERAGAICFMIGIGAAVRAYRGDRDLATSLRQESFDIMVAVDGTTDRWDPDNHY